MEFKVYKSSDHDRIIPKYKEFNTLEELEAFGREVYKEPHSTIVDSHNQLIINFVSKTIEIYNDCRE